MKVVLISSGVLPVPPPGYGGLEQIIADLAIELKGLGHDVYVVAPTGSAIGKDVYLIDCGMVHINSHQWEATAFEKYKPIILSDEFKGAVIHDHTWGKWIYRAKVDNPQLNVISTLHGMLPYHKPPPVPKPCFVGLSKKHADQISAGLGIPVRYCYNGIDLEKYSFNGKSRGQRYLFLARMTAFKGAHIFIDFMRQMKTEGDLVGDDTIVESKEYVDRLLQACSEYSSVTYWGGVSRERAIEFFKSAKAYILPLMPGWEEPFGLTVVEAMATGCPVIATESGAMPELIEHGVTGYVAKTTHEMPQYLTGDALSRIKGDDCRKQAEKFSRKQMALSYIKLYEECIKGGW